MRSGPMIITITATKLIFLAFLVTNSILISWPLIQRELPRELQGALEEVV